MGGVAFELQVQSMSIGILGGSAHEGVCIAAGVVAAGGRLEQRKEKVVLRWLLMWLWTVRRGGVMHNGRPYLPGD
jgi:hypothetical protein